MSSAVFADIRKHCAEELRQLVIQVTKATCNQINNLVGFFKKVGLNLDSLVIRCHFIQKRVRELMPGFKHCTGMKSLTIQDPTDMFGVQFWSEVRSIIGKNMEKLELFAWNIPQEE